MFFNTLRTFPALQGSPTHSSQCTICSMLYDSYPTALYFFIVTFCGNVFLSRNKNGGELNSQSNNDVYFVCLFFLRRLVQCTKKWYWEKPPSFRRIWDLRKTRMLALSRKVPFSSAKVFLAYYRSRSEIGSVRQQLRKYIFRFLPTRHVKKVFLLVVKTRDRDDAWATCNSRVLVKPHAYAETELNQIKLRFAVLKIEWP